MIKGLKQDHNILADLIFTNYQTIQTTLVQLFDTYIELFQLNYCSKLLECIYIKQKLSTIKISENYLRTITFSSSYSSYNSTTTTTTTAPFNNEIPTLLNSLDSTTLPIFNKALVILTSIYDDYVDTPYAQTYNLETVKETVLYLSEILESFKASLSEFSEFLSKCQIEENFTKFSPNSFCEKPMIIINFEGYEQLYSDLFNQACYLEDSLKDFKELVRKESPCFKEYIEKCRSHSLGKDNEPMSMMMIVQDEFVFRSFEMDDFEKFSMKRKERLGVERRKLFSEF